MVVTVPREKWTDERLDDPQEEMREGFARIDADVCELRGEVKDLRREMNARFEKMNESINARFHSSQNRNPIGAAAVIVAASIGVNLF
jgi:hypothetical protein